MKFQWNFFFSSFTKIIERVQIFLNNFQFKNMTFLSDTDEHGVD